MKDRHLVHRLSQADPEALREIYQRYKDSLLTVAMTLLTDAHAAEDCVHDVFVHFAGAPTDMRARRNLKGYLIRCVVNRAKNMLKRQQLASVHPLDRQDNGNEQDCPESRVIVSEESRRIFAALAELPREQRDVVGLHINGQMRFREIAALLDVSINTAKSRYRYGIEKLRTLL